MREYRERINKLSTAKERIKRFLTDQDILLSADDIAIMKRWEFVDKKMAQGITATPELRKAIIKEFSVSFATADSDVFSAQEVFGETRRLNKKYLAHLHLQDIHADLNKIRKVLFDDEKKSPTHQEISALAKLHDAYTYQLNSVPDDERPPDVKRPVWIFLGPDNKPAEPPMSLKDALAISDKLLSNEPVKINTNA